MKYAYLAYHENKLSHLKPNNIGYLIQENDINIIIIPNVNHSLIILDIDRFRCVSLISNLIVIFMLSYCFWKDNTNISNI